MYTVKDASVAFSLMSQRFQPSNTSLLLDEYFLVCKLYGDTATARETHQRYITQIENMRGIFTSQTLRNSEHEAFRDANADRTNNGNNAFPSPTAAAAAPHTSPSSLLGRRGSTFAVDASSAPAPSQPDGPANRKSDGGPLSAQANAEAARDGGEVNAANKAPSDTSPSRHRLSGALSMEGERGSPSPSLEAQRDVGDVRRGQSTLRGTTAGAKSSTSNAVADGTTRNAASYTILRREWGHENYEEQFHKPWNAFLRELSGVMTEVVTAWVSDLDECTPYSQHLIRRSSTCCYDAAHGMCLLRWNTMREVRAYIDALHAVVNAPLSSFFVPLTLGMQVLGVPVLCMSLAPVTGPWQGWDAVTVVWHSFCGLCANLRLMRPLDRAEGGRSETANGPLLNGIVGGAAGGLSTAEAGAASPLGAGGAGGQSTALERSVAWSLLRQLEPGTSGNDYYGSGGVGAAGMSSYDTSAHAYAAAGVAGAAAGASWDTRRNSVFRGDPTSLTNSATGMVGRVSRQVFASAAAGQGGPFARSGGLQLTPAIGADARWYFIDARAICLYQWYARASWMAARVPRREMFQSENGCVQRGVGPNKLILQSKLRIMVGQLLNGLLRFNSNTINNSSIGGSSSAAFAAAGAHSSTRQNGFGGSPGVAGQRQSSRGKPPVLLSTLCHSHGVRYGTYVYAIVDLLRTEEASLDEAVQAAHRHGSSSPNKCELLKQCRRCIQAVVGELVARVIKHLVYQEWYTVIRQNPDWLHRFHSLCVAVAEAEAEATTMAVAAAMAGERCREAASPAKKAGAATRKSPSRKKVVSASATGQPMDTPVENASSTSSNVTGEHPHESAKADPAIATPADEGCNATPPPQDEDSESAASELVVLDAEAAVTTHRTATAANNNESAGASDSDDEENAEEEDGFDGVSAAVKHRRLLAFIDETREALGASLLDAVRRVLNGVFAVNMNTGGGSAAPTSPGNASGVESNPSGPLDSPGAFSGSSVAGNSVEQQHSSSSPLVPFLSNASGLGTVSGAGVSINDSSNRFSTDEAGRSLAASSAHALGGYPVFNPQLSAVTFRPAMFEELLLAVNECYVVRPYTGNEKMSEWQLLHKRTPVVTRRSQYARTPPVVSSGGTGVGGSGGGGTGPSGSGSGGAGGGGLSAGSGGGGGGAVGSGSGVIGGGGNSSVNGGGAATANSGSGAAAGSANGNGGDSWLGRGGGGGSRSGLSTAAASAPASPAAKRGRSPSRLRGAIPVYYPAADEESIQVDAKELFPGWSLQCLEEMIGVPLVLRQNRVDVDSSFGGADVLRALSPSLLSSATAAATPSGYAEGRWRKVGEAAAVAARPPLSTGSPLRSAVWGTTLELPLCLHGGSVESALEYAQHQREIGIAIVSSGLSATVLGQGRGGVSSTFWRERNPHMVYMGKLIQLHAADVRIACRGWPIMEDFDFIKQSDQPNERMLGGAAGRVGLPQRRGLDSPLAHRQHLARARGGVLISGGGGAAAAAMSGYNAESNSGAADGAAYGYGSGGGINFTAMSTSSEDVLTAMAFNASMHTRLSLLNARVDLHEAMSSMWHLTECMEGMSGSHVVYGYLLRQKIEIIATVAAQFTASGVTTALEAAIADLDVLTGGIFNFSSASDLTERNTHTGALRPATAAGADDFATSSFGRRVARSPRRPFARPAFATTCNTSNNTYNNNNNHNSTGERCGRPTAFPPSPRHGRPADDPSQFPAAPLGSPIPALEPSQTKKAASEKRGNGEAGDEADQSNAANNTVAAPGTNTTPFSVDRLRSVPLPPPITQRQVAVVAAAAAHSSRASFDLPNALSVNTPLLDEAESVVNAHSLTNPRTLSLTSTAAPTPLLGSIAAFKSFILRSVQCVDLYTTLLELLTRHMLLPDAHRTPKESLSRAVMFCSLRRELIVMTHGENSVEAAMAASDVGLLLLQNPKTWPQAKTEFYRARRSITFHLRELTEEGNAIHNNNGGGGRAERQLAASAMNLEPSVLGGPLSASVFAQDGRGGLSPHGADRLPRKLFAFPVEGRGGVHAADDTPNAVVSTTRGDGGVRNASTFMNRESWTSAPDRLKQALCSVLNNIAYLFCRQAQRQYVLNQQSMHAYVRAARRQNTLHKPSTGLQLRERRVRRAAKVDHFLNEASTTLHGVLHHASDIPVYDYAVALNNQACVLLHRYQYAAARRLLLQSLRITTQLQSFSVAPVTLPAWLASAHGSSEPGSVLWLLDPTQLSAAAGVGTARNTEDSAELVDTRAAATTPPSGAAAAAAQLATASTCTTLTPNSAVGSTTTAACPTSPSSTGRASESPALMDVSAIESTTGGANANSTVSAELTTAFQCSTPTPRAANSSHTTASRATHHAPNALSTIAAMLKELGAPLVEPDGDVHGHYYYNAAGLPPEHGRHSARRGTASPSSIATAAAAATSAVVSGSPTATATAAFPATALSSPITVSSAEQLRNCQVHTLRMLYQLEVQKSYIDRLRVQQLFRRYLASWRERREQRRAAAATELHRVGVAAMTRVYLARRYRFSGYHWWLRQPREMRRHLDPLLDQRALTTRQQLWDVWNAQVESAARKLQRVLRGAAVRYELAAQFQFRQVYITRCRPAVEEAVWQKMNLLYTSVLMHLHVQEGLRGMSSLKEAVQSGALWMARVAEPLLVQQGVSRVSVQLKELQRREALERDFYKTLARQRLSQLRVAQMKESVLLVIRSPRPSFSVAAMHAERGGAGVAPASTTSSPQTPCVFLQPQPLQQPTQKAATALAGSAQRVPYVPPLPLAVAVAEGQKDADAALHVSPTLSFAEPDLPFAANSTDQAAPTKHADMAAMSGNVSVTEMLPASTAIAAAAPAAAVLPRPPETVPGTTIPRMTSPLSESNDYRSTDGFVRWEYTPPAAFSGPGPSAGPTAAAPTTSGTSPRLFIPPSSSAQPSPSSPTTPSLGFSRSRRARQVVIQADSADLDVDVAPSPRTSAASEERYRQMQRQYREDERAKMTQLRRRHAEGDDEAADTAAVDAAQEELSSTGAAAAAATVGDGQPTRKDSENKAVHPEGGGVSGGGGGHSPVTAGTEEANTKWRQALQRVVEPRSSVRSDSSFDRHYPLHGSMSHMRTNSGTGNSRELDKGMLTPSMRSASPFSPSTPTVPVPPLPPPSSSAIPTAWSLQERRAMLVLPCPDSVVAVLPSPQSSAPSSPPLSSAAASSTTNASSSRVSAAAAEVQRHQLQHAASLLLQFWWTKRAMPTFAASALAVHRAYNEHCCAVHATWVRETAVQLRVQQLLREEELGRYTLWQSEAIATASRLLLQVHSARCCRESEAHARLLATTLTAEERRGRAALLLAAFARGR